MIASANGPTWMALNHTTSDAQPHQSLYRDRVLTRTTGGALRSAYSGWRGAARGAVEIQIRRADAEHIGVEYRGRAEPHEDFDQAGN